MVDEGSETVPADAIADEAKPFIDVRDEVNGERWRRDLDGERLVIGRSSDADITLKSHRVSRRHAQIYKDPFGRWWVRDMGSRNGTRVNGSPVSERVLYSGDVVQIASFAMRLRWPSATASESDINTSTVQVIPTSSSEINALTDIRPPKLDTQHLVTLTEFGHRLYDVSDRQQRMQTLCELMLRDEFHGLSSLVLRIDKQHPDESPETLARASSVMSEKGPAHVSQSVLQALRKHDTPVLASNVSAENGVVELSISPEVAEMSVIACPLNDDGAIVELLYVSFPATFGTGEWLALVALTTKHFQLADDHWAARSQAREHEMIEQELRRASELQMRLVPKNISINGMDVAIGFRPCRWVGGDYVDVIRANDGRTFMAVADMTGKGLQAALVSTGLHTMVHASLQGGMGLQQLMESLDMYVNDSLPGNTFVTMVGVMIDTATGEFEYINAGHPPAMLIDDGVRQLEMAQNFPLGINDGKLKLTQEKIEPGQLLAMYSDGLTEATENGELVGIDAFGEKLGGMYSGDGESCGELAERLSAWLDTLLEGGVPNDDRTFLLARRM